MCARKGESRAGNHVSTHNIIRRGHRQVHEGRGVLQGALKGCDQQAGAWYLLVSFIMLILQLSQ